MKSLTRTSISNARNEFILETNLILKTKELEEINTVIENRIQTFISMEGSPDIRKYILKKLEEPFTRVHVLEKDIAAILKRLRTSKKSRLKNTKLARRKFRKSVSTMKCIEASLGAQTDT